MNVEGDKFLEIRTYIEEFCNLRVRKTLHTIIIECQNLEIRYEVHYYQLGQEVLVCRCKSYIQVSFHKFFKLLQWIESFLKVGRTPFKGLMFHCCYCNLSIALVDLSAIFVDIRLQKKYLFRVECHIYFFNCPLCPFSLQSWFWMLRQIYDFSLQVFG